MAKSPDDYDVKYSREATRKKRISASSLNEAETFSVHDVPLHKAEKKQKKEVKDTAPVNPDMSSAIQQSSAHFELPPDTDDI